MTTPLKQTNKIHGIPIPNHEITTQNNNLRSMGCPILGKLMLRLGEYGLGSVRTLVKKIRKLERVQFK